MNKTDENQNAYLLDEANKCLEEGNNVEAIAAFTILLNHNPEIAFLWMQRGRSYQAMQNHDQAITDFTNAIKIDPKYYDCYKYRALSYMYYAKEKNELEFSHLDKFGDKHYVYKEKSDDIIYNLSRAIRDLKKINKFYQKSTKEITFLIADAYKNCGLYYKDKAIDYVISCANNNETCSFEDFGLFIKAISNFTKAINIDLSNAVFYYERADCYSNFGFDQEAINDYTKVIELSEEFSQNYFTYCHRSLCYYKIKEYNKSLYDMLCSKKLFEKELELNILKKSRQRSIIDSWHTKFIINVLMEKDCPNIFFIKSLEILFELDKHDFYNEDYLKQAELYDADTTDYDELFIIKRKLSLLKDISEKFIDETLCFPQEKFKAKTFNQQANFMLIFFKVYDRLNLHYTVTLRKLEKEKAQAEINERNKVIADLSHSIKNLISSVIDPLENLKTETTTKQPIIDSAIKGANLVREIVNAMNLSYKGSIDDFRYDAKNNEGGDKQDIQGMIIESIKNSVGNMYDGKYFSAFQEGYFPTKEIYDEAKLNWSTVVSQESSLDLDRFCQFLRTYLFEPVIDIEQTENFIVGNEKGSAVKLFILFNELILNAVKYSALIKKDKRFVNIKISHNSKEISILVENRFNPRKRIKTTGLGNVVIANFAKLLNTSPVINRENDIYSVQITFENFWNKGA